MSRLNQDAIIALILLLVCSILFWSTFSIRTADYGTLAPSTWPRVVIFLLWLLSAIYLFQSIQKGSDPSVKAAVARQPGLFGWLAHWKNPIICFVLFFGFLLSLPILGSLIGGVAFVFLLMSFLGGFAPRDMAIHMVLALTTIGTVWAIFTFWLGVLLPPGIILSPIF
jgi:putative tricarboxylic transport membrane protein